MTPQPLPLPTPRIVKDADYPRLAKHKTNAAYEKYGIVPGAFVDDDTHELFASESWAKQTFVQKDTTQRKLGEHECGHDWKVKDENHPTTVKDGFLHAMKCGFDTRAYTRFLRFFWNKAIHKRYEGWEAHWAAEWRAGRVPVHPGSDYP